MRLLAINLTEKSMTHKRQNSVPKKILEKFFSQEFIFDGQRVKNSVVRVKRTRHKDVFALEMMSAEFRVFVDLEFTTSLFFLKVVFADFFCDGSRFHWGWDGFFW